MKSTMKHLTQFSPRLTHAAPALLLAALLGSVAGCSTTAKTKTTSAPVQLMFVQSAEDATVDPATRTLRLMKVNPQTLYFSDRPVREAGHYTMSEYLGAWSHGKDDFNVDPPNATLSVYEPNRKEQVMAVIKISNPVVDGADLLYTYQVIEGAMPMTGGATALFIDWVAARPGVGRGGVGGPGVGGPRGVGW